MMDKQLVKAINLAKKGDKDGFTIIYERTYHDVYFHARTIMKSKADAEDLTQEVFTVVFESITKLEKPDSLYSWLWSITYRQGMKIFRRRKRCLEEYIEDLVSEVDLKEENQLEKVIDQRLTAEILKEAIEELSEIQRMTVLAYYYDELSISDIAEIMECGQSTVKSRLNYARKKLKKILQGKEKEGGYNTYGFSFVAIRSGFEYLNKKMKCSIPAQMNSFMNQKIAAVGHPAHLVRNWLVAISAVVVIGGTGIGIGIMLASNANSPAEQEAESMETDWSAYIGAWCDKGNEENNESPQSLQRIVIKSVDTKKNTILFDAESYVGKRIALESDKTGEIKGDRIEIDYYDWCGSRIEGEIIVDGEQLASKLEVTAYEEGNGGYGTGGMPLEMNCVMVKDKCADTRDKDRSRWDTAASTVANTDESGTDNIIAVYDDDYVFPNSEKEYLDLNYLRHCTPEYLKYGRNEIYARHGRIFQDENIQSFFEYRGKNWYKPTLSPEEFDTTITLNEYEKANAELIKQVEAEFAAGEEKGTGFIGIADRYTYGSAPILTIVVKEIADTYVIFDINGSGPGIDNQAYTDVKGTIIEDTTVTAEIESVGTVTISWKDDGSIEASAVGSEELQRIVANIYWGKTTNPFSN